MKHLTLVTMQLKTPGGIERFISTLAEMLSNDYQIEIVSNYGKPTDALAFPLPKNVKLTSLTPIQPQEISMKKLITSLKWHKIPAELKRRKKITSTQNKVFKNYFNNLKTDYIITDRALYSKLVAKYYHGNAQKIATDHNYHQNNPKYINELLSSISSFDYLVVATKELQEFYSSKTPVKCIEIPNPLPKIPSKKSKLNSNNLLSVGRLVPEKDYPLLIDTMKIIHDKNPDIHLTIIGDGLEKTSLKAQINSLNLGSVITLTGWLPQSEIEKYYYDSSLFVMTSKTEAFGLALAEAMSYGLPCLALARASGAKAQLKNGIGFLIQNQDVHQIAEKITKLLNDRVALQKQQVIINKAIQKYNLNNVADYWKKILSSEI